MMVIWTRCPGVRGEEEGKFGREGLVRLNVQFSFFLSFYVLVCCICYWCILIIYKEWYSIRFSVLLSPPMYRYVDSMGHYISEPESTEGGRRERRGKEMLGMLESD